MNIFEFTYVAREFEGIPNSTIHEAKAKVFGSQAHDATMRFWLELHQNIDQAVGRIKSIEIISVVRVGEM